MQISQFFINGDIRGAIAYMRCHAEFRDILPDYVAVFENREYRTYPVPDFLNEITVGISFTAACRRRKRRESC